MIVVENTDLIKEICFTGISPLLTFLVRNG